MKGMRVQSIIRELRGEKIDIIEYSDDPVVFATHALSPAKIQPRQHCRRRREAHGSDRRRHAAVARHRQKGAESGWPPSCSAGGSISRAKKKAQEVESQMAAMVRSGAPVSVLIDHGVAEEIVERLLAAGIGDGGTARLDDAGGAGSARRRGWMVEKILARRKRLLRRGLRTSGSQPNRPRAKM